MTERPILFSAPMVRALLDGTKTQTRRIVKLPPAPETLGTWEPTTVGGPDGGRTAAGDTVPERCALWHTRTGHIEGSPFVAGDRLWVREAWRRARVDNVEILAYRADGNNDPWPDAPDVRRWRPSIHMPRVASRITLEVVDVRVERLHDITDKDAIAEGVEREGDGFKSYETIAVGPHKGERHPHAIVPNRNAATSYLELFYSINAKTPPGSNPWVWCVEFRRVL